MTAEEVDIMASHDESGSSAGGGQTLVMFFAWLAVGAPLVWGIAQTIRKALALFR